MSRLRFALLDGRRRQAQPKFSTTVCSSTSFVGNQGGGEAEEEERSEKLSALTVVGGAWYCCRLTVRRGAGGAKPSGTLIKLMTIGPINARDCAAEHPRRRPGAIDDINKAEASTGTRCS